MYCQPTEEVRIHRQFLTFCFLKLIITENITNYAHFFAINSFFVVHGELPKKVSKLLLILVVFFVGNIGIGNIDGNRWCCWMLIFYHNYIGSQIEPFIIWRFLDPTTPVAYNHPLSSHPNLARKKNRDSWKSCLIEDDTISFVLKLQQWTSGTSPIFHFYS